MKNYNQSALMTAFNLARWWGRRTGLTTDKRTHKALSYLMKGDAEKKWEEYETTLNNCRCKDQTYRPQFVCNHRVAKMVDAKHDQIMWRDCWQYQKAA